ncbi:uncharacterized protein BDR25DRAFT_333263 [Lindgomyces ingoldianus]|uniref:Uncharacterized protein n=1 Tax=Lindgomyces ingoldianus TaxID=673940 RepID=A0ACB6QZF8_9PLEO|nr:uncharacterized protein BDR25DRAFT_333263 [Lindgomyces ingoldianus]KAF2472379.1 hypothetical protein BDR25DRAFT_333263 [Lindgomyces ingoldianus]
MSPQDIEAGQHYAGGYASFAEFIERDPELAIYRRFQHLSARNILYLQSELVEAEKRLAEFDKEDREQKKSNTDVMLCTRCWISLRSEATRSDRAEKRETLILKIRLLMKEYHEAILLQSQVMQLENPLSRTWEVFRKWYSKSRPLIEDFNGMQAMKLADFVALRPALERDRLSQFLHKYGGYATFLCKGNGNSASSVHYFSEQHISQIVTFIGVLTSAILLIGAIVSLYVVGRPGVRLGMIAGFTILFALSVALFTNARRAEIFTATAAYAAVLVVFVSGNLGSV